MACYGVFVGAKSRWQFNSHYYWNIKVHSSCYLWSHNSPENI